MEKVQCSVYLAVSVDGYMARPDGGLDWLDPMQVEGEDYGFAAFYESVDVLVMGRATWNVACSFPEWPYAGKRVIVLTSQALIGIHEEQFFDGDVCELVAELQKGGGGRVYVDGGVVIRQFLTAGLVDDLTLSVVPRILGDGIPLFGRGLPDISLNLRSQQAFSSGLVQLCYDVDKKTDTNV